MKDCLLHARYFLLNSQDGRTVAIAVMFYRQLHLLSMICNTVGDMYLFVMLISLLSDEILLFYMIIVYISICQLCLFYIKIMYSRQGSAIFAEYKDTYFNSCNVPTPSSKFDPFHKFVCFLFFLFLSLECRVPRRKQQRLSLFKNLSIHFKYTIITYKDQQDNGQR